MLKPTSPITTDAKSEDVSKLIAGPVSGVRLEDRDRAAQRDPHRCRRRGAEGTAVPGEHPLEVEVEEPLQRAELGGPGIPADAVGRGEAAVVLVGPEMVACEEDVAVEERAAASRMSGDRDDQQIGRESDRVLALERALDVRGVATDVGAVEHALAAEPRAPPSMVGHVVAVGKEHPAESAELLAALGHPARGPGRVDEDVADV